MAKVFGENTGKGFIKEESNEIFAKAMESAIFKAPVRNKDKIYISDLWFITSLPKDLICEIIKEFGENLTIPEDINFIYDDKNRETLWERKEKNSEKEINDDLKNSDEYEIEE
ncbi:hypothetical protein OF820_04705 [Oceanotoga sp. DSM 15011]|uniref:hypothetical protein n=1 Tax=Oceanotoga sp. DSM 15011 TaxID=2984951 RepID=UPI0021F492CD|nr:hypothetical protein [Oceanotoga sp. DSM 15011]UYP00986.1 hypothetical protein OF820_04705 [Oceanotoga sp. DSM 15011]